MVAGCAEKVIGRSLLRDAVELNLGLVGAGYASRGRCLDFNFGYLISFSSALLRLHAFVFIWRLVGGSLSDLFPGLVDSVSVLVKFVVL